MKFVERRRMLKAGALVSVTAISGLNAITSIANSDNGVVFNFANLENPEWVNIKLPERLVFEKFIGDVFWIRYDDYSPMLDLTLKEIITLDDYAFILRFHTLDSRKLSQVTHLVEHAQLGRTPMFLTANPVTESEHLDGFEIGGRQKEPTDFYYEVSMNYMPISPEQEALIPLHTRSE